MASAALGSVYVLSSEGVAQLADLQANGSAPVETPGFVSGRPADADARERRLTELQRLVAGIRR